MSHVGRNGSCWRRRSLWVSARHVDLVVRLLRVGSAGAAWPGVLRFFRGSRHRQNDRDRCKLNAARGFQAHRDRSGGRAASSRRRPMGRRASRGSKSVPNRLTCESCHAAMRRVPQGQPVNALMVVIVQDRLEVLLGYCCKGRQVAGNCSICRRYGALWAYYID
jgi:hypothetical protein